jgi:hypothetical protein
LPLPQAPPDRYDRPAWAITPLSEVDLQRVATTLIEAAARVTSTKRANKTRRRRLRAVAIERHHPSERRPA